MKKCLVQYTVLLLFCFLGILGCQKEELVFDDGSDEELLPKELSDMVMRIVTHDGSFDDVVDGANCFSIDLPYTIELNGENRIINTVDDYVTILPSDEILIKFPILITTHSHQSIIVENQEELEIAASDCSVDDEDIECVDFVYPFRFRLFNPLTNRFKTIQVLHDKQIFEFMRDLNESAAVSIEYPIDLTIYNGQKREAGHNESLMKTITEVVNACDENDN